MILISSDKDESRGLKKSEKNKTQCYHPLVDDIGKDPINPIRDDCNEWNAKCIELIGNIYIYEHVLFKRTLLVTNYNLRITQCINVMKRLNTLYPVILG